MSASKEHNSKAHWKGACLRCRVPAWSPVAFGFVAVSQWQSQGRRGQSGSRCVGDCLVCFRAFPRRSFRGDPSVIVFSRWVDKHCPPGPPTPEGTAHGCLCPGTAVGRSGGTPAHVLGVGRACRLLRCTRPPEPRAPHPPGSVPQPIQPPSSRGRAPGFSEDPAEQSHACSYHTFLLRRATVPLIPASWQERLARLPAWHESDPEPDGRPD